MMGEGADLPGRIPDKFCRPWPSRRWSVTPTATVDCAQSLLPQSAGWGEEEKKDFAGGNRTVRTQPGDGVSPGAVTVTAGTPRQRRDCGLSPLWSPPQSPEPSPCGEKDIRQIPHKGHRAEHLPGPPQKRRVIRAREVCKTVTQRGGFGRRDESRQGGVPDGILGQKKTLGKHLRRPE